MQLNVKKTELVKKREEKNLSQYGLSILAGLSNNAIFRMENGKYRVNHLRAKAVADALSCSVEDIFEVQGEM